MGGGGDQRKVISEYWFVDQTGNIKGMKRIVPDREERNQSFIVLESINGFKRLNFLYG
jgi:hypothetical protein